MVNENKEMIKQDRKVLEELKQSLKKLRKHEMIFDET